jgi:hypothetical protein
VVRVEDELDPVVVVEDGVAAQLARDEFRLGLAHREPEQERPRCGDDPAVGSESRGLAFRWLLLDEISGRGSGEPDGVVEIDGGRVARVRPAASDCTAGCANTPAVESARRRRQGKAKRILGRRPRAESTKTLLVIGRAVQTSFMALSTPGQ